jgi:uncharacterized membrane protein YadS
VVLVIAVVTLTILARSPRPPDGIQSEFGLLSGGATAICGASAAMAISAALPSHPLKERATLFTIIGVSTLSTVAMILYPAITQLMGFDDLHSGIFIGATIHDVAQVVGAGYAISPEAGDTATVVKLMRVAMLLPVIIAAGLIARDARERARESAAAAALVRLTAFLALVVFNSLTCRVARLCAGRQDGIPPRAGAWSRRSPRSAFKTHFRRSSTSAGSRCC